MNLGLIIPCRNEASVIVRKLRNLRELDWPEAERSHRVVVVDDHSDDETASIARGELQSLAFPKSVVALVISSELQAGKPGAVRAGLQALGAQVDCCGLTDADVILERSAPRLLLEAFERDPELAMACGEQAFVEVLPEDGQVDPAGCVRRDDAFDRATAWCRRLESRSGSLFSVHGQLLVWRAELELEPRLELAADDLDLMLQVRDRRPSGKTCLVRGASFYECKTPPGAVADAQALRRARAYVQVVRSRSMPGEQSFGRKLQWLAYRNLPLAAPTATLVVVLSILTVTVLLWGVLGLGVAVLVLVAGACTKAGRVWLRVMRMIRRGLRLESQGTQPQSWEMARTQ